MTGLVVAISGKLRSGKTSVSKELSRQLGWPRVAFGDYVRAEVESAGGDPMCRRALQDYGLRRVEADPLGFCSCVLGQIEYDYHTNLIVDGVRHKAALESIRQLCMPMQTRLVYIKCTDKVRYERANNLRIDDNLFSQQNQHPVELESEGVLEDMASFIADCEDEPTEIVRSVIEYIRNWSRELDET